MGKREREREMSIFNIPVLSLEAKMKCLFPPAFHSFIQLLPFHYLTFCVQMSIKEDGENAIGT
jgi:hypothetical protein